MAQENFFEEDFDFGVENASNIDTKEFDAYMNDSPAAVAQKDIKPATETDKAEAKEKGKAKSEDEIADQIREKRKQEEEDARKFIEGDEEEQTKTPSSKKADTSDSDETEEVSGIEDLANDLYKVGIFTKDEDDEESPTTTEEFIEKFNNEKRKGAEELVYNLLGKHGEEYREALEAILISGVPPKEYLRQFEQVQSFKEMDMTDEDNQERVVVAGLKNQGWEDADIKDEIKRLKIGSDLETVSIRYQKALVKTEEQRMVKMEQDSKAASDQKKIAEQQFSNSIRQTLAEKIKTSDFDGIPVNREKAEKAIAFVENKNWKLPSGELITDYDYTMRYLLNAPHNTATKLKIALLLAPTFDPSKPIALDLVPIEKRAVSKENTELFNFGKRNKKAVAATPTTAKKQQDEFLAGL